MLGNQNYRTVAKALQRLVDIVRTKALASQNSRASDWIDVVQVLAVISRVLSTLTRRNTSIIVRFASVPWAIWNSISMPSMVNVAVIGHAVGRRGRAGGAAPGRRRAVAGAGPPGAGARAARGAAAAGGAAGARAGGGGGRRARGGGGRGAPPRCDRSADRWPSACQAR